MLYLSIVGEAMSSIKNKRKKQIKVETIKNIAFSFSIVVALMLIIILSLMSNNKKNSDFHSLDITNFSNISVIGVNEYLASLNFNGTSIIFFCSSEEEACYDELNELDKIAKQYNLIIEYVNVLELVESEKEILSNTTDIFNDNYFPHLLLIQDGKILNDNNKYLKGNEIKEVLKEYEIIK